MWNLVPWNKEGGAPSIPPFEREFSRLRTDFDSLLERMWSQWPALGESWLDRRLCGGFDVEETATHYVLHVTAPGFEPGDFDVSLTGNQLTVKAEKKESHSGNGNGNGHSSYRFGCFQRTIPLPEGALSDLIEAEYKAGILVLKLPKGPEKQPKRIAVRSA
jgi:HSP20 family molecular chaperone IbpA